MNIKSLLLGSAAALAVVSGAQAADAIVAAEPEPMEYVRVCDAFGTGYFYIPGTETCLRISGEVRATLGFGNDAAGLRSNDDRNWETNVRARVNFDAKNDSEIGTIGSRIRIQAESYSVNTSDFTLDEGYITVGGLKVGRAYAFWDDVGLPGENDAFTRNTNFNLISYEYAADAFTVGVAVHDLSDNDSVLVLEDEVGVEGKLSASLGAATVAVYGVYDFGNEEGAVAGLVSAEVGPGTLSVYGAYSSGANLYVENVDFASGASDDIEWTVGGAYGFKATDKLTITPSVNYWEFQGGSDAWGAGILAEYAVASGLTASATVDYFSADNEDDVWTGFVRLTRSF